MEEYRNKTISLHANRTQIISKFTSRTRKNPLGTYRGAMGGASPRLHLAPQEARTWFSRETGRRQAQGQPSAGSDHVHPLWVVSLE